MDETQVLERAFSMPIDSPAYPAGPYRFVNREYVIVTYETDEQAIRDILPAPLEFTKAHVKLEFIKMPDSTGFGDYCESGAVIPCLLDGRPVNYVQSMYLNDHPPIAAGRELWGFPKKLGQPELRVHTDTIVGELRYSDMLVARATMGFKHVPMDIAVAKEALGSENILLKIMPHVDGTPRICELVSYRLVDITVKGAWMGPGSIELHPHALAPMANLPVRKVLSSVHFLGDMTLPYGTVVHDYLVGKVR